MKVVVKFHESARLGLQQYKDSLDIAPDMRAEMAHAHLASVCELLRESAGILDTAVQMPDVAPPTFFLKFAIGWQARYSIRRKGSFIMGYYRSITIHAIEPIPPLDVVPQV